MKSFALSVVNLFLSKLMTFSFAAAVEAAEKLKSELATAWQEAEDGKAAAKKANADLEALKTTSNHLESHVGEVEKNLQEAAVKYEALEEEKKKQDRQVSELTKAGEEARSNARRYEKELRLVEQVTTGKPYLL